MMFDLWPVYSVERFRASGPSCCIYHNHHLNQTCIGILMDMNKDRLKWLVCTLSPEEMDGFLPNLQR